MDAGAKLVDEAGVTMREIVDSVRHVTDIISEIAAASEEQNSGIEQINQAISQMDQVTQQNAALVEEAAAAAESLQGQGSALAEMVSVFQLGGDHAGANHVHAPVHAHHGKPPMAAKTQPARPIASVRASVPARRLSVAKEKVAVQEWDEF